MVAAARCQRMEVIPGGVAAGRYAMSRRTPADLVVLCVDKHPVVMAELEEWSQMAQAGAGATDSPVGDPDLTDPAAHPPASRTFSRSASGPSPGTPSASSQS